MAKASLTPDEQRDAIAEYMPFATMQERRKVANQINAGLSDADAALAFDELGLPNPGTPKKKHDVILQLMMFEGTSEGDIQQSARRTLAHCTDQKVRAIYQSIFHVTP